MQAQCSECDSYTFVPHSCGHRNCPHCQHHESRQWLERQLKKQVPAEYFLLTFTLPSELRDLAWCNQRTLYSLPVGSKKIFSIPATPIDDRLVQQTVQIVVRFAHTI